jgi:uncharacterized membrane protein YhaH (DUF805 family)
MKARPTNTVQQVLTLFPRQITRRAYLLRVVACLGFYFGFAVALSELLKISSIAQSPLLIPLLWVSAIVVYLYVLAFVAAPRLRDIGFSPYLALAFFFPGANVLVGLLALFAPTGWWTRTTTKRPSSSGSISRD